MAERFPEIEWKVTAGNSSQITDGAAALLLMSEETAAALGLRPRARIYASTVVGDDPLLMLTGPIPATHKVLARAGLCPRRHRRGRGQRGLRLGAAGLAGRVPVADDEAEPARRRRSPSDTRSGASGARLMTTLLHHLEQTGGRYGLQTMCEAGGMANATIVESLGWPTLEGPDHGLTTDPPSSPAAPPASGWRPSRRWSARGVAVSIVDLPSRPARTWRRGWATSSPSAPADVRDAARSTRRWTWPSGGRRCGRSCTAPAGAGRCGS